jgi:hypothetical protein
MFLFSSCFVSLRSAGQHLFLAPAPSTKSSELSPAPEPQPILQSAPVPDGSPDAASTARLFAFDKLVHTMRSNFRVVRLLPALYSAGYEQLAGSDPKYGSDAGAGAVKFGAAMLRETTARIFPDGIFASVFHQDPRSYRVANGSILGRGLRAAERSFVRRSDDGADQINFSGIAGRAASAALTLAYYPKPSRNTRVVLSTFGISFFTRAGGNLILEFFRDLSRRFPALKKIQFLKPAFAGDSDAAFS